LVVRTIWGVVRQVRFSRSTMLLHVEILFGYVALTAGGVSLAVGRFSSLYWVAAGVFVLPVYALSIAWNLVVDVARQEEADRSS
jgi:hypothetical protein